MRQLILYIIFMMTMVFSGYGKVSAASDFPGTHLSEISDKPKKDRLQKVDHNEQQHEAQLEDASSQAYRICSTRPTRMLPNGNIHSSHHAVNRLPYYHNNHFSSLSAPHSGIGPFRRETAPIHFDVASKYYVICLRHLIC